jgi:hypothetical protein
MRRRARRRGLVAGAVAGGAIAHHQNKRYAQEQDEEASVDNGQGQYVPSPADPADQIEHLAQLHSSGALTDAEFAAAKANLLGS